MRSSLLGLTAALMLLSISPQGASAQYFGKNKVHYTNFKWSVLETEHFHVYYYDSEREAAVDAARMAERSYARLAHVLRHEFTKPIPLVLYASHSQFQETNILPDQIDEGTGGVTEFLKQRVFLPFTGSYAELEHVLSHELVHAFQVDILFGRNQSPFANPFSYQPPGWFMEGMAEYLSLGGVDANTEMWLRDGALQGYLVPLTQMDYVWDIRAYRFGQSVWEYIARRFGEEKVGQILRKTAQVHNAGRAIEYVTGITLERLSEDWLQDLRVTYLPQIARYQKVSDFGRRLTNHEKDGSNFNVVPAVSPTGDKVAYISDRGLATSLYLASAIDGKDLGRLVKGERTAEYEALRFFTSAIDWSPDGTRVAFPAKSGARDALYIIDTRKKKKIGRIQPRELDAITSPCWSPDGSKLAFTGYAGGQSDLYVVDADGSNLVRLTADRFADMDPRWSPDGTTLVFSTDRFGDTDFDALHFAPEQIALCDATTGEITALPAQAGKNISPHWSPDGGEILFVSDRSGITNLYVLNRASGEVRQISDLLTGVSGITNGSPPVTVSRDGRRLIFSAFQRAGWDLYAVKDPFQLPAVKPADPPPPPSPIAAGPAAADTLAPVFVFGQPVRGEPGGLGRVAMDVPPVVQAPPDSTKDLAFFGDRDRRHPPGDLPSSGLRRLALSESVDVSVNVDSLRAALMTLPDSSDFRHTPYKTKLTRDVASTSALFGSNAGLAGQAILSFSDILGNKNVLIAAGIYGSLLDSDVLVQYTDQSRRTNFGAALFQYRNDFYLATRQTSEDFQSFVYRGAELFLSRPFSKFNRVEFSVAGVAINEKVIRYGFYTNDEFVLRNLGTSFYVQPGAALVRDTAVYGSIGPIDGTRARLSVDHAEGDLRFTNAILDYRTYRSLSRRYSLAWRLLGATSAGHDPQIFRVGGPYTLRSVDYGVTEGSHLAFTNLEFRFPFIDRLNTAFPLPFSWPSIRGAVFFDAGAGWGYNLDNRKTEFRPFTSDGGFRLNDLTAAYGVGLRMGLGFLILRYDVAQPTNLDENLGHALHFFSLGADF